MASRADKITPTRKRELFSDFLMNLDRNPITGALARKTNEEAVKESIKHLVLTNVGERPYSPLGSKVQSLLFDPADVFTEQLIEQTIRETIETYEPRAQLIQVQTTLNPDYNEYDITIYFSVLNTTEVSSLNISLKRVR